MKLSILIPTFNFVCTKLVQDLSRQCQVCGLLDDYEIIVVDDGSTLSETRVQNQAINTIPHCLFQEGETNIGRSKRLNQMAAIAKYPYILIADSDAEVCSPHFISEYLKNITRYDVLCGGILTSDKYAHQDNQLRFRYEKKAGNIRKLAYRNKRPYQNFTTFNIMLRKSVFDTIRFDEALSQYGYEDTMFGMELQANNVSICHIDNPLVHTGIDSNTSFLEKTEKALQNLYLLQDRIGRGSYLLTQYRKLSRMRLDSPIRLLHHLLCGWERRNLLGRHPSLLVFKLYKLGYFITWVEKKKKTVPVM